MTGVAEARLFLAVRYGGAAEEGVGFEMAICSELLEVELVPEGAALFGAVLPEKERAYDAVPGCEANARLEATVTIRLLRVELGAVDRLRRRGGCDRSK